MKVVGIMKKRILCALFALALLCVLALPVIATGNAVSAEADKSTLSRGDTVTVTVDFTCEEAVSTVSALLEYDAAVFELAEGKCAEGTEAVFTSFNEEHAGLALLFSDAKPREGELGRFVLKVKAAAPEGETELTVKPVYKNGADELKADSVKLKLTVGCVHDWDAQGVCVHCKAQKPVEPTLPPASAPSASTPPATTPPATATPVETTYPAEDELDVSNTTAPAEGAVSEEETITTITPKDSEDNKEQPSVVLWVLLLIVVICGAGVAGIVLLKKRV